MKCYNFRMRHATFVWVFFLVFLSARVDAGLVSSLEFCRDLLAAVATTFKPAIQPGNYRTRRVGAGPTGVGSIYEIKIQEKPPLDLNFFRSEEHVFPSELSAFFRKLGVEEGLTDNGDTLNTDGRRFYYVKRAPDSEAFNAAKNVWNTQNPNQQIGLGYYDASNWRPVNEKTYRGNWIDKGLLPLARRPWLGKFGHGIYYQHDQGHLIGSVFLPPEAIQVNRKIGKFVRENYEAKSHLQTPYYGIYTNYGRMLEQVSESYGEAVMAGDRDAAVSQLNEFTLAMINEIDQLFDSKSFMNPLPAEEKARWEEYKKQNGLNITRADLVRWTEGRMQLGKSSNLGRGAGGATDGR